jgi:SAM-dependent methyltransferase
MNDQATFWNGPGADRWVRDQILLDALLSSFSEAALGAAETLKGESAVDVGCGCGTTTLELAKLVSPSGRVVGLDLSAPMLARAKEACRGLDQVTFTEGDASEAIFDYGAFDLLFSRFGVMFFPDPKGAFQHLRLALAATGRVSFVCWRSYDENPWAKAPIEAVADIFGHPDPSPPDAPGPFSFGDASRVRSILEGTGFHEVNVRPFDAPMAFARAGTLEDAAREVAVIGPVSRLLVGRSDEEMRAALAAIGKVLPPYASPNGGVSFPGAAWIVTASNSGVAVK